MFSSIGYAALVFCVIVMAGSLMLMLLGWRWSNLRASAIRLLVVSTIFAIASAYVWIQVGPSVDYRTQVNQIPRLPLPVPKDYWV